MAVYNANDFFKGEIQSPAPTSVSQPKTFGQHITDLAHGITNFVGAKGISDEFGASLAHATVPAAQKPYVDFPSFKTVAGSAIQAGANLIPGAGKGFGLLGKTAIGAGTGYAFDVGSNLQQDTQTPFAPGIGTAVGGALPVAGAVIKPATAIVGRLMKGLGSGLSGVSSETIDKILQNPEFAQKASAKLAKSGNNRVLEDNARTIINGVGQIGREASNAYGEGLDSLAHTDINPDTLKAGLLQTLDKHGVGVGEGGRLDFSNAEFLDPKVQQRAEKVVNHINQFPDLSGKGVRKIMDTVDTAKFKSAPDGDRQAFNAFMGDLKSSLKESVSKSTDKLGEINQKYSTDMQLSEAAQNIFGKVNFRNLPEVVRASQRLENLFSQKGLAPEVVDNFLKRIGVNPEEFKTTEAVRQIDNVKQPANSQGLSMGEVARSVTSAVVTPDMVKNLSIVTGLSKQKLSPILQQMKPVARNILIQALLQANTDNSQ